MADIELIYSQQPSDFVAGRAYSNPRFYSTPRSGVSKVYLVGDWPQIEADYTALGVPVERLDAAPLPAPAPAPAAITHKAEDPGSVIIPDGWADLSWQKLRSIASQVSDAPVKNGDEARAAIEAELNRRELDEPRADALGLTLRELHGDLTALGIYWTPDHTPADKLRMRDEARALNEAG
jgi:hypothetical protein